MLGRRFFTIEIPVFLLLCPLGAERQKLRDAGALDSGGTGFLGRAQEQRIDR